MKEEGSGAMQVSLTSLLSETDRQLYVRFQDFYHLHNDINFIVIQSGDINGFYSTNSK